MIRRPIGRFAHSPPAARAPLPPLLPDAVYVALIEGQSLVLDTNQVEAPDIPTVPHWVGDTGIGGPKDTEWHALNGDYPSHRAIAAGLLGSRRSVAVLALGEGGTFASQWVPGQAVYTRFVDELEIALPLLPAQFPGKLTYYFLPIRRQGQAEARYFQQAPAQQWDENFELFDTDLRAQIAALTPAGLNWTVLPHIINRTNTDIASATFIADLQVSQTAAAAIGGRKLIDTDALPYADGVHPTAAGYSALGSLEVAAALQLI